MRPGYSTLTPAVVHRAARQALAATLGFGGFGRSVTPAALLDLLLRLAATARTLFAVVTRHFPFSHETGRRAVRAHLPTADALGERLADALHAVAAFSRRDRRRRWTVALDTHAVLFYGDRTAPGVAGGPRDAGTHFAHTYATAALLHRRRRYTVGPTATGPGVKLPAGDRRRGGPGQRVRQRAHPAAAPAAGAQLRPPSAAEGKRPQPPERRLRPAVGHGVDGRMADRPGRAGGADAGAGVAAGGGGEGVRVRRVGEGAEGRRAWLARRRHHQRFGIETSYRQKNQAGG